MTLRDASKCFFTGKRRWGKQSEAVAEMRRIRDRSRRSKTPKRAFFCKLCNGWHLTSEPKHRPQKEMMDD